MTTKMGSHKIAHPFLCSFSPEHLKLVLHHAKEAEFASGEIVLKEGEPANRMFLIQKGRVAIQAGAQDGKMVQILHPGETLGWSWLFPPFSWHFSARALEATKCIVLNGGHLLVTAEENPEFGYELMRRITQIVIGRLQATRKEMLKATFKRRTKTESKT